jgi:glycosyltransferase involved in cell wall biosynthesis
MRIAFYAPLKSPTHGTPSGDRRVAGLLMDALARAGHRVELVSTFRSYDAEGDAERQAALRAQGGALGRRLAEQWLQAPAETRPDLWFTYHLYYKAPDWLGPVASAALGIPYVIAEPSNAGKRAGGPWRIGHEGAAEAIRRAHLLLCPIRDDIEGLERLGVAPGRIERLAPFLDSEPFQAARRARTEHRARLARAHGLDPAVPWLAVAAMMRAGDKLASFRSLAAVLARAAALPWRLVVAGDGPARAEVEAAFAAAIPGRAALAGALPLAEVAALYAACDLCVWPAVNEAYGMALLEAQAAGVPVIACAARGVPDVVMDGRSGLLAAAGDEAGLASLVGELLSDGVRRESMGKAAAAFVEGERSIEAAAARLGALLARLRGAAPAPSG